MGKFVISTRKNGEFQFNLIATNNQVILTSEAYNAMAGCEDGIDSVKKNATIDTMFLRKKSSDGKDYFNLMANNALIIGTSEMYNSAEAMENGIESVKKNAPDASIEKEI